MLRALKMKVNCLHSHLVFWWVGRQCAVDVANEGSGRFVNLRGKLCLLQLHFVTWG